MKNWFISQNNTHTVINIFGIKLKWKPFFNFKMFFSFMYKKVVPKTILIIEFNDCHFETIPGLCKYCLDLGYNVDVLTRVSAEKIFENIKLPNLRIYESNIKTFEKIYEMYDFQKYDRIIYNSRRIYQKKKESSPDGFDCYECYNKINYGKKGNIYLQHHIDKYQRVPGNIQIILANPSKSQTLEKFVVNCHWFKNAVKINNSKNNITNFISVGELSKSRRNTQVLINAVELLQKQEISNFKITIIGRGELDAIPTQIRKYFNILGRIDYQAMFNEIEKADFFLPLLDPTIKEHDRYKKDGTSGSFQLIYGFLKPCIIHREFADIYELSEKDSLIYEENKTLSKSMMKAIEMKQEEYKNIQSNLKKKVEFIEEQSLKNLRGVLSD